MDKRRWVWVVWAVCGTTICLASVSLGTGLLDQGTSQNLLQYSGNVLRSFALPVALAVVAALIVSRHPRNTIGWLMLMPVGMTLVSGPIEGYLQRLAPSAPAPTVWLLLLVWFDSWSWLLLIVPLLHIPLLFPDGRPPSPRWYWVGRVTVIWTALLVLIVTLSRRLEPSIWVDLVLDNPIGILAPETVDLLNGVWVAGTLTLVALCVAALFVRYRRANATERKQIAWLLYACAIFLVVYVGGFGRWLGGRPSIVSDVWDVVFGLCLVAFPVAIGIAILRHQLFDIEIIIRRTLVYTALTGTLAVIYLAGVVTLQGLLRPVAGGESDLAVVAATLGVAGVFHPLRRRIQAAINRRFYRRAYDAARILDAHRAAVRDEVDVDRLTAALVQTVAETMQPAHASLWLRPPETRR
jgi:hypothetical protein